MSKNILIFSDGTGQLGGVRADQRLSNIYKMYRAMRPWPDSPIEARDQVAFYDPGLGTGETGKWSFQRIRNVLASAFGTGISENIVDCYEAILKQYEPGDRVYLFGFSRGAYTARCVANVMNQCGVPRRMTDGAPLARSGPGLRRIAEEAVYKVYEHGSGKERAKFEEEREELARRFRERYDSQGTGRQGEAQGNVAPTFIGVFDTVAALGSVVVRRILFALLATSLLLAGLAASAGWAFVATLALLPAAALLIAALWSVRKQFKSIRIPPRGGKLSWHFAAWNLKHYDRYLDNSVGHARHALSIDESRTRFPRVPWASSGDVQREDGSEVLWLDQVWFAGNHSDIGGSYPEEESRLSDIALNWMLQELASISHPPSVNPAFLQLSPDARGLQHDEVDASRDNWLPGWVPFRLGWRRTYRQLNPQAKLHPSVLDRLGMAAVPHYGETRAYRPEPLRSHLVAATFYP